MSQAPNLVKSRSAFRLPQSVIHLKTTASTQDVGLEKAKAGETNVVIIADTQTEGRGRAKIDWDSQRGGLWASFVFDVPISNLPAMPAAAAVAVAGFIEDLGSLTLIKWPNDILLPSSMGKVAGLLIDCIFLPDGEHCRVILGVGVNIENETPDDLDYPTISLSKVDDSIKLEKVRDTFVNSIVARTLKVGVEDPESLFEEYNGRLAFRDQQVSVIIPGSTVAVQGTVLYLDEQFRLVIRTPEGLKKLPAGSMRPLG